VILLKTFSEYNLKGMRLKNRIVMPPMCMYSSDGTGLIKDWHLVHYLSRAVGGVGLIIIEATAITPNGRISGNDLGIWEDKHIEGLKKMVEGCKSYGSKVALQLAHAGRKCDVEEETTVAPSSYKFSDNYKIPKELSVEEIEEIIEKFKDGAERAHKAGFDSIEIHGAHGYLIHEFLSPLSNRRKDQYGGSLENRTRFLKEILKAIKEVWPKEKPILLRVSADDYKEGGINIDEIIQIINNIKEDIDMIHVSSGGLESVSIEVYPGYQIKFSEAIRRECDVPTIAVGLLTKVEHTEEILSNGRADLVALGRELLRDPYWTLKKATENNVNIELPIQYERGFK